jgi:hypothetical protein
MDSFWKYILQQTYNELSRLGDRSAKTDKAINWETLRPHAMRCKVRGHRSIGNNEK